MTQLGLTDEKVAPQFSAWRLGRNAELVAFLSSEQASYIAGQSIVDGGAQRGF
ncbi:hypothetical protein [Myxococcus sp. CA040A]|uniref:hypothetical protein n=1 Tax=Myxococcus sp. CA040A TaxID=2741738 RepID=UPI0020C70668|nr:hypothetical protein [Myxococcus sp. CA040A]